MLPFSLLQILERTLEPDSSDEEPPPVYSPPSYEMHIYDRKHPADVPPFPPPRQEHGKEKWEFVVDLMTHKPPFRTFKGYSVVALQEKQGRFCVELYNRIFPCQKYNL